MLCRSFWSLLLTSWVCTLLTLHGRLLLLPLVSFRVVYIIPSICRPGHVTHTQGGGDCMTVLRVWQELSVYSPQLMPMAYSVAVLEPKQVAMGLPEASGAT